jgi:hypothetical protein
MVCTYRILLGILRVVRGRDINIDNDGIVVGGLLPPGLVEEHRILSSSFTSSGEVMMVWRQDRLKRWKDNNI